MILPLNDNQLAELPKDFDWEAKTVRFMCEGKSVNICTGDMIGGNIIHQYVYWDRPNEFVRLVLKGLRENNPGKAFRSVRGER